MELAASQKLLARVYTDSVLRNRFFADPVTIGASFGLSADAAKELAGLPKEELHKFTKSLRRQRLESVGRELPLTRQLLGRRFAEIFKDYVVKSQLPEKAFPWMDAVRFVDETLERKKHSAEVAQWELEFMRYECTHIAFNNSRDRFRSFFSLYRVHGIRRRLEEGSIPTSCAPIPCCSVFWRWTINHPIAIFSL